MYNNPTPVSVCLLPIEGKLLGVKRGIEPKKGFIALPGGYINSGETWQEACVRELFEETGFKLIPMEINLFSVESAVESNHILIFGIAPEISKFDLDFAFTNDETEVLTLIEKGDELAFPLHTQIIGEFFS
ncbi:MAG: NUDIX domain-containing protein [Bdellovibrionota bacterium]